MRLAVDSGDRRGHVYDSVDQLGAFQFRHLFPPAQEFITRQLIAVSQSRRQKGGGHRSRPSVTFRLAPQVLQALVAKRYCETSVGVGYLGQHASPTDTRGNLKYRKAVI